MPVRFACLRFMNDPRPLSRKVVPADGRPKEAQSKNIKSVGLEPARQDYAKFDAVSVRATRNISPEEKLFGCCVQNYDFESDLLMVKMRPS